MTYNSWFTKIADMVGVSIGTNERTATILRSFCLKSCTPTAEISIEISNTTVTYLLWDGFAE